MLNYWLFLGIWWVGRILNMKIYNWEKKHFQQWYIKKCKMQIQNFLLHNGMNLHLAEESYLWHLMEYKYIYQLVPVAVDWSSSLTGGCKKGSHMFLFSHWIFTIVMTSFIYRLFLFFVGLPCMLNAYLIINFSIYN